MSAWRIEVSYKPELLDPAGAEARQSLAEAGLQGIETIRSIRGTLLPETLSQEEAARVAAELLTDPVTETWTLLNPGAPTPIGPETRITVARKPGVQDPVAASTVRALADLGLAVENAATYHSFLVTGPTSKEDLVAGARRVLANDVIEEISQDLIPTDFPPTGTSTLPPSIKIPIRDLDGDALVKLSDESCLSLTLTEMETIQEHYRAAGREPTDVELETLAQTWSEHCKHKTLTARVSYKGKQYNNLLKETIAALTHELDRDWCRSVFVDNAGVVDFDGENSLAIKVETHNHPSAIEPFGGAGTGIGGVIRDIMGTGLGARPVASTDIFCFAPMDMPRERRPEGSLNPLRVLKGVVAGVRDYGNPMGIPTVNGSVSFDEDFAGNPLVYVGCVGIMPTKCVEKEVKPGDVVVVAGGRTGRDGIHGATFSSVELSHESETTSSGAVQIGDPIMEKKTLEGQLRARDLGLYRAITDCGAGGLSSAVGEMGETVGAEVELAKVPLKYQGLAPWEIWVSEAQERMVMAVPPENLDELLLVFAAEEVEATPIGTFGGDRLLLKYNDQTVADLNIDFLHNGVPKWELEAKEPRPRLSPAKLPASPDHKAALLAVLADPNVASKEWIIRQYDHEVQAGSAGKPLCGPQGSCPADAAVVAPIPGNPKGFALGHGLQVQAGKIDPRAAAAMAVDEAMRNVIAAGADPDRICILDNYCWGNPQNPELMGSIIEATLGACDAARVYRTPFVSGKDSLNNEFRTREGELRAIPGTLLITAMGIVSDVRHSPATNWSQAGLSLWALGRVTPELGGSIYLRTQGQLGDKTPQLDAPESLALMTALHRAIEAGLVTTVHDVSEGGLAVTLTESAFGSGLGAEVNLAHTPRSPQVERDDEILFSESPSRFLVSVAREKEEEFAALLADLPAAPIGQTIGTPTLLIRGHDKPETNILEAPIAELEKAWRGTFDLGHH